MIYAIGLSEFQISFTLGIRLTPIYNAALVRSVEVDKPTEREYQRKAERIKTVEEKRG